MVVRDALCTVTPGYTEAQAGRLILDSLDLLTSRSRTNILNRQRQRLALLCRPALCVRGGGVYCVQSKVQ